MLSATLREAPIPGEWCGLSIERALGAGPGTVTSNRPTASRTPSSYHERIVKVSFARSKQEEPTRLARASPAPEHREKQTYESNSLIPPAGWLKTGKKPPWIHASIVLLSKAMWLRSQINAIPAPPHSRNGEAGFAFWVFRPDEGTHSEEHDTETTLFSMPASPESWPHGTAQSMRVRSPFQ